MAHTEHTRTTAEQCIFDFAHPATRRAKALDALIDMDAEAGIEAVNRLLAAYRIAPVVSIARGLREVVRNPKLGINYRIQVASQMHLLHTLRDELAALPVFEHAMWLREIHKEEKENVLEDVRALLRREGLSTRDKFKVVLAVYRDEEDKAPKMKAYKELAQDLDTRQTIALLCNDPDDPETIAFLKSVLESDAPERSDAADAVLNHAITPLIERALEVIKAFEEGAATVYDNPENAHAETVRKYTEAVFAFLRNEVPASQLVPFETIVEELDDEAPSDVLDRIYVDETRFTRYRCTIAEMLQYAYTYFARVTKNPEHRKRLVEELNDMADTCATGFATRLANVFSGFGIVDAHMMDCADEIEAVVHAYIVNALKKSDAFEDVSVEIVDAEEGNEAIKTFMRAEIPAMHAAIWNDYARMMPQSEFDVYFKNALIKFGIMV